MIGIEGAVRVLVAAKPVDFRKGMDGLAALVQQQLGADPFSGVVYVFRSKRADRVKLLHWDGTGLVLIAKRLEAGQDSVRQGGGAGAGSSIPGGLPTEALLAHIAVAKYQDGQPADVQRTSATGSPSSGWGITAIGRP